ncbi:MAG TPA: hypothetical protein VMF06_18620, partial [Candidatus Limnocylindria bacterium]|nr:hypothetical protein [Candidatus Limnocylindria bacterium]
AEKILEWIDHKTRDASTFHRLRKQPWILSALLKPFFGREVENSWSAGRTFHFSSLLISAQRTRPLRRKALAIIERFWRYDDVSLRQATIPVLCEAVSPLHGRFGNQPSQTDYDSWQIDRLETLQVIERAATKSSECPALLLQLRSILRDRIEYDPDQVVQDECRGILKKIPDTFELGVARVLTSFSNDEVQLKPGPTLESQLREANRLWSHFRNSIGIEVAKRFPTAGELCEFVRRQVRTLRASNLPVRGDALLESVAMISPLWCSTLLDNLLASRDETLDVFLWPMFHHASINAKESYHRAITSLPLEGRVSQLSSLVNYLGWKHIHGGGMTPFERQALFQATGRTETEVMHELSTIVAYRLSSDQELAIGILKRLTTRNERVADEILVALSQLATASDSILTSADVSLCLKNIGPCCFPETFSDARNLNKIAKLFPRQIYDHVRALHENTSKELDARHPRQLVEPLELGCFKDQSYVEQEIQIHWTEAKSIQPHSFEREYRLSLIQSLLWSDSASAFDRITQLIEASSNIDELIMIAGITATPGSQFVFRSPNLVRRLLSRSDEFFALAKMREALWLSACGGGRSFTNQELDPEYRYVLEQGETLANRYHDDRILGEFYRGIAKSERRNLEWHKSIIAAPELD